VDQVARPLVDQVNAQVRVLLKGRRMVLSLVLRDRLHVRSTSSRGGAFGLFIVLK
jgi:hypothetical protein